MLYMISEVEQIVEKGEPMEDMTIRQIRLAKEITLQQMAERLGVHPNTYAAWEKEPNSISIGNAFRIAEIFGMSVDDIFLNSNSTKC